MTTTKIGAAAASKTAQRLAGPAGVGTSLAALTAAEGVTAEPLQVQMQNVAADLAERAGSRYPAANVYCQRIQNTQKEKFRRFSGRVLVAVEVRHTQDRLDGLDAKLELYADAVAQSLQSSLGDWGDGMFYGGAYEVVFGAVKQGGRNFMQAATVTFALEVSR